MPVSHLGATRIACTSEPDETGKILLVGEINPLSIDPQYALYHEPRGCAGHRLQSKIFGLDPRRHYLTMWRTNLCTGSFDQEEARERAATLVGSKTPWTIVIMLGVKVEAAFSSVTGVHIPPLSDRTVAGIHLAKHDGKPNEAYNAAYTFVYLPHPSGRNTTWNDSNNVMRARRLLTELSPRVPWGEIEKGKDHG